VYFIVEQQEAGARRLLPATHTGRGSEHGRSERCRKRRRTTTSALDLTTALDLPRRDHLSHIARCPLLVALFLAPYSLVVPSITASAPR